MIRRPAHLPNQPLHAPDRRAVRGHGDGPGAGGKVGERVEGLDGRVARGGFARGDVDFGAACLEESGGEGVLGGGFEGGGEGGVPGCSVEA